VKPIKRQIEAYDSMRGDRVDNSARLANRALPYLMQIDRAVINGVLDQDGYAVQTARFGIDVDLSHTVYRRGGKVTSPELLQRWL
jgi:hypothetical protein